MRKRGKVKIVLTVFIIVLFSCTAVIGNSRTGVIGGCGRFLGPKLSNSKTASILHRTQTP